MSVPSYLPPSRHVCNLFSQESWFIPFSRFSLVGWLVGFWFSVLFFPICGRSGSRGGVEKKCSFLSWEKKTLKCLTFAFDAYRKVSCWVFCLFVLKDFFLSLQSLQCREYCDNLIWVFIYVISNQMDNYCFTLQRNLWSISLLTMNLQKTLDLQTIPTL